MSEHAWIWLAFLMGLLVRWGDRIQFVLSENNGEGKSVGGFLRANWVRLVLRLVSALYIYRLILGQGWVTNEFLGFSVGISFDTLAESILDRAKRFGESTVQKLKGQNT